jgi:Xaa-Pro aminopeptidase
MHKLSSLLLVLLLTGATGLTLLSLPADAPEDPPRDKRYQTFQRQRIDLYLLEALQQEKIDLWLVVTRENNPDPLAQDLFAHTAVLPAALFFEVRDGKLRTRVICANFDATPFEQSGVYEEVITYGREGLWPHLKQLVEEIDPERIGVNISELEPLADGLSAGLKSYVENSIGERYAARMVSAQNVVSSFRSRKVSDEIAIYREAVRLTIQLEEEALSRKVITPGVTTEIDVANYLRKRMIELNVTCAWGDSGCPNVMAGAVRGHSDASATVIEPGRLVRIDFGIKIHGYCTDIQRMAYVLREGETEPPAEVQKAWETVLRANEAAVAAMRPGVPGVDVDTAARKVITDAGYDEFIHATGHPVGYFTHDVGPLTGPDWPDRYGDRVFRKLEAGQIHAIEPSLTLELPWIPDGPVGVGLEEQVLVTEDGAEYIGGHQTELILIR